MEESLWKKIIDGVRPLKKKKLGLEGGVCDVKPANQKSAYEVSFIDIEDIKRVKKHHIFENKISVGDVSRVDKSVLKHMKSKNFLFDAKLDLHGQTLEAAFKKFSSFINSNYENGRRNLLVITGKGNPSKNTGVIKKNLPLWINHDDIDGKILYISTALYKDGGDGAFQILLRKK